MPKQPANWPAAALPRRLTREWAAFYCGVSPNTFDAKVKAGEYPKPDQEGRYDLKLLDQAIDRINGIVCGEPEQQQPESWAVTPRSRGRRVSA